MMQMRFGVAALLAAAALGAGFGGRTAPAQAATLPQAQVELRQAAPFPC